VLGPDLAPAAFTMMGICGEHGGDPASIRHFDRAGLD
jgi:phosphoenolpyruvate synthase/pyruvate phosphate dikinase